MGESEEYYVLTTDWSIISGTAAGVLTRNRMDKNGKEEISEVIGWVMKDLSALKTGLITPNGSMWGEFYGILLLAEHFGQNFPVNCLVTTTDNAAIQALLDGHDRCLLCWLRVLTHWGRRQQCLTTPAQTAAEPSAAAPTTVPVARSHPPRLAAAAPHGGNADGGSADDGGRLVPWGRKRMRLLL